MRLLLIFFLAVRYHNKTENQMQTCPVLVLFFCIIYLHVSLIFLRRFSLVFPPEKRRSSWWLKVGKVAAFRTGTAIKIC